MQAPRDQQAAYQPSGNGTTGHAIWLSLAASGGSSMVCGWAKKSSWGGCNGRSHGIQQSVEFNFAHHALSGVRERKVSKVFCFQIE